MRHLGYLTALTLAAALSTQAYAATDLSSSAYGASVVINVDNVLAANAMVVPADGNGPPAYNVNNQLANVVQTAQLIAPTLGNVFTTATERLTADLVTSVASGTASSATGTNTIANLAAGLNATGGLPLAALGITADAIDSTTTAGFTSTALYSSGNATITNLRFSSAVLGLAGLDGLVFSNPNANTVAINALGLRITLNEQGTSTDATSISRFTNAIHVSLNDFLFNGGLLNGDVIIGHSQASVTGFAAAPVAGAVPEPATWMMLITGFTLLGGALRAGRRRAGSPATMPA